MWEDLKDIRPPMYDGNPLNPNHFFEKLDDWGMTVTEDMDPAAAEKYISRQFRLRLREMLQELYLLAAKEVPQPAAADGRPASRRQEVESHQASA